MNDTAERKDAPKRPGTTRAKLLVLTSTFPRWPGDTVPPFVFELSRRLTERFEVHALAPLAPGSKSRESMDGIVVHRFRYLPGRLGTLAYGGGIAPKLRKSRLNYLQVPFFVTGQLAALLRLVRKEGIALIHAHWLIPQGFAAVACSSLLHSGPKVLVTVHGADLYGFSGKLGTALKRSVARRADRITAVSSAMAADVERLGGGVAVEVAPMGIDTAAFAPERRDESVRAAYGATGPLVLFVGRLVEKKGLEYLLRAMPGILSAVPDARLLVVGDGPLRGSLVGLADSLGIGEAVLFAGSQPHDRLPALFASADLFVGPSIVADDGDTEGFGLVFAEAMSCGTPVIASDLPAVRDIVRDGETGFLVPPKDPKGIAGKAMEILAGRHDLARVRASARLSVCERFSWEKVAGGYADRLEAML